MGVLILEGVGGGSRLPTALSSEPLQERQTHNPASPPGETEGRVIILLGFSVQHHMLFQRKKHTKTFEKTDTPCQ